MEKHLIEIHEQAKKWVEEIIPFIKESVFVELTVDTKSSANDLVTNVDKAVEAHFRTKIQQTFPTHGIIGEEYGYEGVRESFDSIWVIDPIDGTTNFVKQKDYFCVLVSYYEKDIGELAYIYDVMNDDFYYAMNGQGAYLNDKRLEKPKEIMLSEGLVSANISAWSKKDIFQELLQKSFDIRFFGCGGIDSIHVFNGKFAAFVNSKSGPWDLAAQLIFAKELGLKTSKFNGSPVDYATGGDWVLANEGSYDAVLEITKRFNLQDALV